MKSFLLSFKNFQFKSIILIRTFFQAQKRNQKDTLNYRFFFCKKKQKLLSNFRFHKNDKSMKFDNLIVIL